MAADTAYLEGGPCAGTTHKITAAESDTGEIVCKGALYRNPEKGQLHHGDIVFKYAGKAPTSTSGGKGLSDASMHKGWADVQRSINRKMPAALHESRRLRKEALRALGRARKVKR